MTHATWKPYFATNGTDWWVPFYPADYMKQPTGPLCDGCHSVEYDIRSSRRTAMTSAFNAIREGRPTTDPIDVHAEKTTAWAIDAMKAWSTAASR